MYIGPLVKRVIENTINLAQTYTSFCITRNFLPIPGRILPGNSQELTNYAKTR